MPGTILLVDDDPIYRSNAQEYLTDLGYDVLCVADADEAMLMLNTQAFAVTLLDIRLRPILGDESGLLLAKKMVGQFATTRIMVTKHASVETAREALRPLFGNQAPAADYVVKEAGLEALAHAIERVIYRAKVFICYARPDFDAANKLYNQLAEFAFVPWMDRSDLRAGKHWRATIKREIRDASCFVLLASHRSLSRKGYYHREIRMALRILKERPQGSVYLLPTRLEDCPLPNDALEKLHWVNLYEPAGLQNLVHGIRASLEK